MNVQYVNLVEHQILVTPKRSLNSEAMGRITKTTETVREEIKEDLKEFKFVTSERI